MEKQKKANKNAACKQKTTSKKENFSSNTVLSLYFKLGWKNFTP